MPDTFYSDLYPAGAVPNGAQLPDAGPIESKVHCTKVRYTFTGTEAASDIIRLFELPAGATILPKISSVQVIVDAASGAFTLDVGDEDTLAPSPIVDSDADRYADGINVASAGDVPFTAGAAATVLYALNEQCWITATFATLATPIDGGILDFIIYWREPSS